MASAKHGPLYTHQDLLRIIGDRFSLEGRLEDDSIELTFPADEPLFLLRASEHSAEEKLVELAFFLEEEGSPPSEECLYMWDVRNSFLEWQDANPDRVKVPSVERERVFRGVGELERTGYSSSGDGDLTVPDTEVS